MAKIIETEGLRRTIRLSTDDIITIVKEYQRIVPRGCNYNEVRNCLSDIIVYIPEDI